MTELLTTAQMRAIEQAAIASGEVTGLELMERAGKGVVAAVFEEWPELALGERKAVVLCGPGNNGGDGFVVARLLAELGWTVEVFLYGDADKLPSDARVNFERWSRIGQVRDHLGTYTDELIFAYNDLFVDALFGTGLSRPLPVDLLYWTFYSHDSQSPSDVTKTVSIDIASGICADSGRRLGDGSPVLPKLTVTFHKAKVGHYVDLGASYTKSPKVVVVDIGLNETEKKMNSERVSTSREESRSLAPPPVELTGELFGLHKHRNDHKYGYGHALILSGPSGQTGAARLAARGALRIGAGLVTIGCPPDALAEHAAHLNAIMLKVVATPADLGNILTDRRINALCLGPGMGGGASTRAMVAAALDAPAAAPGPDGARGPGAGPGLHGVVLDADALTSFADNPAELFKLTHKNTVLTPHGGEFARLFPDIAAKLNAPATKGPAYSKVDATREAAKRAGCVVLFKGPDTVIAHPDGRAAINSAHYGRAAPWLATAGSGDVLAGFIAGLMARGVAPMQAAETAAWLHVECARAFGPGLIAEDLPEELPKVFRALGL